MQASTSERPSRRRLVITIAFIAALFLQGVYSFAVSPEPYPTIRMPSFRTAADADGEFPVTVATIEIVYSDGSTVRPTVSELLGDFRFSVTRPSHDFMFKPPADRVRGDVLDWLRVRSRTLGDGAEPVRATFTWRTTTVDVGTGEYAPASREESTEVDL